MHFAFAGLRLNPLATQRRTMGCALGVLAMALGAVVNEEQAAGLNGIGPAGKRVGFLTVASGNLAEPVGAGRGQHSRCREQEQQCQGKSSLHSAALPCDCEDPCLWRKFMRPSAWLIS